MDRLAGSHEDRDVRRLACDPALAGTPFAYLAIRLVVPPAAYVTPPTHLAHHLHNRALCRVNTFPTLRLHFLTLGSHTPP